MTLGREGLSCEPHRQHTSQQPLPEGHPTSGWEATSLRLDMHLLEPSWELWWVLVSREDTHIKGFRITLQFKWGEEMHGEQRIAKDRPIPRGWQFQETIAS